MRQIDLSVALIVVGLLLCGVDPAVAQGHSPADVAQRHGRIHAILGKEQPSRGGGARPAAGYAERVVKRAEALMLSDEQLGKIVRIGMRHRKAREAQVARLHRSMRGAMRGVMNPSPTLQAVRKAVHDHTEAFEALIRTALKERAEVDAVLTSAQRGRLMSLNRQKARAGRSAVRPDRR